MVYGKAAGMGSGVKEEVVEHMERNMFSLGKIKRLAEHG